MTHETLWAPWRLDYVKSTDAKPEAKTESTCFLCDYVVSENDRENLVTLRGEHVLVVLNRFPYNNGHLLVAPNAHKADIQELSDEELLECGQFLQRFTRVLKSILNPDGFNIGLNLGRVAGAGLPGHLHWHIVPRWNGDTNFMAVLGDTKVIPQSLDALFDLLEKELAA